MGGRHSTVTRIASTDYSQLIDRSTTIPLLFGLPADFTCSVLLVWLDWNNISKLDIALCSPKQLAEVMSASQFTTISPVPRIKNGMFNSFITWAAARRVKLNHLRLEPSTLLLANINEISIVAGDLKSLWVKGNEQLIGWTVCIHQFSRTLIELQLFECEILPTFDFTLSSCLHLSLLSLVWCRGEWSMLGDGYPTLRELRVASHHGQLSWTNACATPLPNVQRLHIRGLDVSNDDAMQLLLAVGNGGQLQKVILEDIRGTQDAVVHLASQNARVFHLCLTLCVHMTSTAMLRVFDALPRLRVLNLVHCRNGLPNVLCIAQRYAASLTALDLSCSHLSSRVR
jgi:hypothetical protein